MSPPRGISLSSTVELRIPRRLETPNTWQGRHWTIKHRISQTWETEIWAATAHRTQASTILEVLGWGNTIPALKRNPTSIGRRRVEVERHVPSKRHFIQDDDNLRFCVKPLLDALKRQGYIRNDSRTWLEHPTPMQHVSADGKDLTIIRITPCAE